MNFSFKHPSKVKTAPVVVVGLLGSWTVARETGVRSIGASIVGFAGGYATWNWFKKSGPVKAAALLASYVAAAMGAHILAERMGAWAGVMTSTAAAAALAHFINDKN